MHTLAKTIQTYLSLDRAPATNTNYRYVLQPIAHAIGEEKPLASVTLADLLHYTANHYRHIKPTSRQQYLTMIKTFFRWCITVGYLNQSPAETLSVRVTKPPPQNKAIPPAILKQMLTTARIHPRNYAILNFILDTGSRRGGVASLRISNLNLEDNTAYIAKKGGDFYKVFFSDRTHNTLKDWLQLRPALPHDYVFISLTGKQVNQPLQPSGITSMISKLSEKVSGVRYGPHSIRHAVGHAYADQGVPLTVTQQKLGHNSSKSTLIYYPQGDDERLRELTNSIILPALDE